MRAGTGLLEECSCGSIRTMGIQESRQPNFPALQGKGLGLPAVHVQGMLQVWQWVKAAFLETAGLLESCCTREAGPVRQQQVHTSSLGSSGAPCRKGTHAEDIQLGLSAATLPNPKHPSMS